MPKKLQFKGSLFPFQKDVLLWTQERKKAIIALDMGLGKTVISCAIIANACYKRTLIIVPLPLLQQWKAALLNFTDLEPAQLAIYHGKDRLKTDLSLSRVVITTYDLVRYDFKNAQSPLYRTAGFYDSVFIDEAHTLRNHKTDLFKITTSYIYNAQYKWLLTGTVIHNKFDDFTSLLKIIDVDVANIKDSNQLQAVKAAHFYSLTKQQAEIKLPTKEVKEHSLGFDLKHVEFYADVLAEVKEVWAAFRRNSNLDTYNSLLAKILRLRQVCNHPLAPMQPQQQQHDQKLQDTAKFEATLQIINDVHRDDKLIVFSQWANSLCLLQQYLKNAGFESIIYSGDSSTSQKESILAKFRGSSKILLATIQSAGVGLNLVQANHVIMLDSWWNQALENQAVDRVHRIGQVKSVYVHKFYMKDTIEDWIRAMKTQKGEVAAKFDQSTYATPDKDMLTTLLHQHI